VMLLVVCCCCWKQRSGTRFPFLMLMLSSFSSLSLPVLVSVFADDRMQSMQMTSSF
jgi:hypothetical protein